MAAISGMIRADAYPRKPAPKKVTRSAHIVRNARSIRSGAGRVSPKQRRAGWVAHRPHARRYAPPLDLRLELEGVLNRGGFRRGVRKPWRQSLALQSRGSPPRVRRFEGSFQRKLRRRNRHPCGTAHSGCRSRTCRRIRKGEAAVRAAGLQASRPLDPHQAQKTEKEWLLIKERDAYVSTEPYSNESVSPG